MLRIICYFRGHRFGPWLDTLKHPEEDEDLSYRSCRICNYTEFSWTLAKDAPVSDKFSWEKCF